ncbi:C-type lectin domain family 2 member B-like isoform X2 [Pyxicephalus adspersus]|uniref:C-type lectin domain family 2 member B-like isoform X2 n=1 Tax=Pyxicephalus adspersus TaxID=30357 RepID=UPI003B5B9F53
MKSAVVLSLYRKPSQDLYRMGIGEKIPKSNSKEAKEVCADLLTDLENAAKIEKQGTWQKIKSSKIPLITSLIIILIIVAISILAIILTANSGHKEDLPTVIMKTEHAQCPEDWILFRNKCYYFSEEMATWNNSQMFCKRHNSSLAVIDDINELKFLNLFRANKYWIGLTSAENDSSWVWTNGALYLQTMFQITKNTNELEHAFINGNGIKSERGKFEKKWICSHTLLNHPS